MSAKPPGPHRAGARPSMPAGTNSSEDFECPLTVEAVSDVQSWTEHLAAETGWTGRRGPIDWPAVESLLGSPLPATYKSHAETFGWGEFNNGSFEVFAATPDLAPGGLAGEARRLAELVEMDGEFEELYAPHGLFPREGGLLIWGVTGRGDSLFWETAGADPGEWPIVAITEDDRAFSYRMEVSEFLFKCIASGETGSFSIASKVHRGSFIPIGSYG
ncbi:hypothetical protein ACIGZJ_17710 [Kitasatospora sp. NPDC052868]|uniref:hypothetical protein n=1 Tax=Kitasatospora sp. NPDC052868 TaxID=3364060 RepID=UPI0037C686B0